MKNPRPTPQVRVGKLPAGEKHSKNLLSFEKHRALRESSIDNRIIEKLRNAHLSLDDVRGN